MSVEVNGLLPNGKSQFCDGNGQPIAGGTVTYYEAGTSTLKDTYPDTTGTTVNPNPVVLDAAGRAVAWGVGQYRQVVADKWGTVLWDQEVWAGPQNLQLVNLTVTGTATVGTLAVTGNETVAGNLTVSGATALQAATATSLSVSGATTLGGTLAVTGAATFAGAVTVNGSLTLASPLAVAYGGTGAASLPAGDVLIGNGTSAVGGVAPGAAGNLLLSNGSTWYSGTAAVAGVGMNFTQMVKITSGGTVSLASTQVGALVEVDSTGLVTIVLPDPGTVTADTFTVVDVGGSDVNITTAAGMLMNLPTVTTTSVVSLTQGGYCQVWSDGTRWLYGPVYKAGNV